MGLGRAVDGPDLPGRAFYGGPDGPNRGEPPGLLDLPNRHELTLGQAAQAVERSAHPDRYEAFEPVARTILAALTTGTAADPGGIPDLAAQGARTGCVTVAGLPPAPAPFTGTPGGRLDDPTGTGGWVTRELAHLIVQTRAAFPDTGWACWAPRPGTTLRTSPRPGVRRDLRQPHRRVPHRRPDGRRLADDHLAPDSTPTRCTSST